MGKIFFIIFISLMVASCLSAFALQAKHPKDRVKNALEQKGEYLKELLKKSDKIVGANLIFVVFKAENELEIYAKNPDQDRYELLKTYEICARSGTLGYKLKQGDNQTPEGFYYIDRFNEKSAFYLSLGINYPNKADKIRSKNENPGGDIFIHGSCVSIGCMAMRDENIKEIFLLALWAKRNFQEKIPVYIFPFRMNENNLNKFRLEFDDKIVGFWENIKIGYDKFIQDKKEIKFQISSDGRYNFQ